MTPQDQPTTNSLTGTPTTSPAQVPATRPVKARKARRQVPLWAAILSSTFLAFLFAALAFVGSVAVNNHNNNNRVAEQSKEVISSEGDIFNKISSEVGKSVVSVIVANGNQSGSAGTGFVINNQGLILTNKHVIQNATSDSVKIIDHRGREYPATIVGRDPSNDLAFLEVQNLPSEVPPVTLADSSQVKVGDKVLAIGNALGEFQNSVTSGIVSGIGRPIEISDEASGSYEALSNLIQTDAAINPGNSGGPLVNIEGEVIGINTAIVDGAEGIGFSIPVNDAKTLIAQVEAGETLAAKAYLGVRYIGLNPSIASQLSLSISEGALVYAQNGSPIQPGSPAEVAGLKQYDVITHINGIPINADLSLSASLNKYKAGDQVELTIQRSGQTLKVPVTLAPAPN